MTYFYDQTQGNTQIKGRVFEVVSKQGDHKWYEVNQRTYQNHDLIGETVLADFQQGEFVGLSKQDKMRALKRVIR